jgi:hypothetical protein
VIGLLSREPVKECLSSWSIPDTPGLSGWDFMVLLSSSRGAVSPAIQVGLALQATSRSIFYYARHLAPARDRHLKTTHPQECSPPTGKEKREPGVSGSLSAIWRHIVLGCGVTEEMAEFAILEHPLCLALKLPDPLPGDA